MFVFLLLVLIVAVCMLAIYFHIKKLTWRIDKLETQLDMLHKSLTEKNIN